MPVTLDDIAGKSKEELWQILADPAVSLEEIYAIQRELVEDRKTAIQENQLSYYKPVTDEAKKVHLATEHTIAAFGGKGSSKTDTMLVEMIILGTGIVPDSLEDCFPRKKIKEGGKFRIVVESLTTTLYPIILPKLQWWKWDGVDEPGGQRGHWGWIPRHMLIAGEWDKSWNDKLRLLTLANGSTYQFMSFDQSPEDFASGRFHAIQHDEPPPHAIWRENLARVAGYGGTIYLSMTPPDEAGGINVDWIFDEVYEAGQEGSPNKDPDVFSVTLFAEHNLHLDQEQVQNRARQLTWEQREVFLHGRFLHLSNLVHPLFTEITENWCFTCNTKISIPEGKCPRCGSPNVEPYCHVQPFDFDPLWPVVYILDPHPRKPHMMTWIGVSPNDEFFHLAEMQIDGEPDEVAQQVLRMEGEMSMNIAQRIIDPNMGQAPSGRRRHVRWVEDFEAAGLSCELGDDNFEVGKTRINNLLKPDPRTRKPRMIWHPRCAKAIYQYKRYVFDEWARYSDREPKQAPKPKNDDYPAMDRYFVNEDPSFDGLRYRGRVWTRPSVVGRNARTGY